MSRDGERQRRRVFDRHKIDESWTTTTRTAIGSTSLHVRPHQANRSDTTYDKLWNQYCSKVEHARLYGSMSVHGANTLQNMAMNKGIKTLPRMTLQVLRLLPHPILRRMWAVIVERELVTFHTWRMFASLMSLTEGATLDIYRFSGHHFCSEGSLRAYTMPLTSTNCHFLTSLFIDVRCSVPELIDLVKMRNLVALELNNPDYLLYGSRTCAIGSSSLLSDRILRVWSVAARNDAAFPVLRILRLCGHSDVSDNGVVLLRHLPALSVVEVRDCSVTPKTVEVYTSHGWQDLDERCISEPFEQDLLMRAILPGVKSPEHEPHPCLKSPSFDAEIGHVIGHGDMLTRWKNIFYGPPLTDYGKLTNTAKMRHDRCFTTTEGTDSLTDFEEARLRLFRKATSRPYTSWDHRMHSAICTIGLCNGDADLATAGVDTTHVVCTSVTILPAVPIATMVLESPSDFERSSTNMECRRCDSFRSKFDAIKAEADEEENEEKEDRVWSRKPSRKIHFPRPQCRLWRIAKPSSSKDLQAAANVTPSTAVSTKTMNVKNVRENRKRRLCSMLNSLSR